MYQRGLGSAVVAYGTPRRLDPLADLAARAQRQELIDAVALPIAPYTVETGLPDFEALERARPVAPPPPTAPVAESQIAKLLPIAAVAALAYFVM